MAREVPKRLEALVAGDLDPEHDEAGPAELIGQDISRPTSAPPALEISRSSLFAFSNVRTDYARIFTDIRCDENYPSFYEDFQQQHQQLLGPLPPPLQAPLVPLKHPHPHPHPHQQPQPHTQSQPLPLPAPAPAAAPAPAPPPWSPYPVRSAAAALLSGPSPLPRPPAHGLQAPADHDWHAAQAPPVRAPGGTSARLTAQQQHLLMQPPAPAHPTPPAASYPVAQRPAPAPPPSANGASAYTSPPPRLPLPAPSAPAPLLRQVAPAPLIPVPAPTGGPRVQAAASLPRRLEQLSLEDVALEEPPLPELTSSDSENALSSADDLAALALAPAGRALRPPAAVATSAFPGAGMLFGREVRTAWDEPSLGPPATAPAPAPAAAPAGLALASPSPSGAEPASRSLEGGGAASGTSSAAGGRERCRYFEQGFCSRGDKCQFAHALPAPAPLADPAIVAMSVVPPPPAAAAVLAAPPPAKARGKHDRGPRTGARGARHPPAPLAPPPPAAATSAVDGSATQQGAGAGGSGEGGTAYTSIEQVVGGMYALCKDQHGCRFLQRQIEERQPRVLELIFAEVYPHFAELMTDPFGNYLCQKLLEHCSDRQRVALLERVSPHLVAISQNMHGTRAVQRLIEFLSTPEMVGLLVAGLRANVVALIQDLNGNHVVQRCLQRLAPPANQFIYDAVSAHCVQVATHRHGCCVLQRCIDFASEAQKQQLIAEVVRHADTLVRDAFGNYVVQYVMDLPGAAPHLSSQIARRFGGHVAELSTQKFSSNVIEKCLKAADRPTLALMVAELTDGDALLMLLQDPFGNYVVQTALGLVDAETYRAMVALIRPHLPAIRNTPYGKRIQNKILKEAKAAAGPGGQQDRQRSSADGHHKRR